ECNEDKYYKDKSQKPRISLYLKALFEEYAQKPLYAREKIYYAERFEIIRNAIEAGHQLKIQVASSEMYYVKPFRIDLATYHYLTGVSSPVEKDGEPSYQSASFRLSNMLSVIPVRSRSGYLTEKEKENLNKEIQQKGAQFLTANITDVRIKLTESGVQKYNNQIHLRPACKEILPGNIYCFQCTEIQAEYYFFKFGKDAMVMEPESLATRFKSMYGKAWKIYESAQNTETIK
ncbi:MAG: WYL domain-containing protein, partial [Firmicutes bacterium]|nr:WYL domain-containing protein [Bacillota bacterium]